MVLTCGLPLLWLCFAFGFAAFGFGFAFGFALALALLCIGLGFVLYSLQFNDMSAQRMLHNVHQQSCLDMHVSCR